MARGKVAHYRISGMSSRRRLRRQPPEWRSQVGVALLFAGMLLMAPAMALERMITPTLHHWPAEGEPTAVVLALHGFNDHGRAFSSLGPLLNGQGISLYAPDQAGFGAHPEAGRWMGRERLADDAAALVQQLQARYPELPVFLLGKSMGGAVGLLAAQRSDPAGLVLVSPALYSARLMPSHQRWALQILARLLPAMPLPVRAGQALGYQPSDQPEVIEALRADPLVIDAPRADTVAGLQSLMSVAAYTVPAVPTLLLYGMHDDLVPPQAICAWLDHVLPLLPTDRLQARVYPDGYHMLLRFSGAEAVRHDLLHWLLDPQVADDAALAAAKAHVCRG